MERDNISLNRGSTIDFTEIKSTCPK